MEIKCGKKGQRWLFRTKRFLTLTGFLFLSNASHVVEISLLIWFHLQSGSVTIDFNCPSLALANAHGIIAVAVHVLHGVVYHISRVVAGNIAGYVREFRSRILPLVIILQVCVCSHYALFGLFNVTSDNLLGGMTVGASSQEERDDNYYCEVFHKIVFEVGKYLQIICH